ncbi:MAG TPA: aminotransferase class I/II-fold pyridoxal phosphate-dependent enzyme [Spirochaetia bacterium]|nr:aminotransferase class I/II-fold pyridoxal phosphate-dependent enzyme [Spirochaetia bacterium]
MKDSLKKIYQIVDDLTSSGTLKKYRSVSSPQDAWFTVDNHKVLNFCSNNYLGLASNPKVRLAAIKAIEKYGVGTGAVRALSGNSILHENLETALAKFKKTEAVMLVQSGFVANLIAVQTLIDKEDIVISDELNHASIIDAVRISQVQTKFIYLHNNLLSLEEKLKEAVNLQKEKRSDGTEKIILIITDGVFSMDGDIAPLPGIVKLAQKYGAVTMVDDAHGEGVIGKGGRGIVDHFDLHGQVDIEVGTLSKAFGIIGGCIAGNKKLIEYYKQKARPFSFSTGLSIPDTAALLESVKILSTSPSLVNKLWQNAKYLNLGFQKLGFDTGYSETPITPVMIGDESIAKTLSQELFKKGVFATPIVFPMVPKGKARIRVMPSASHTEKDLDFGLKQFAIVGKKMGLI